MGTVIILPETTKKPITMIGYYAGGRKNNANEVIGLFR